MNWACIIFDAMSIFLDIKQLISKAVHKDIISQILSFTHKANSFCIILLRIAFYILVLSLHFPMPLLVPSDGLGVAWGWSGAALGWRGATLAWPGGWRGDWSGLSWGGLGRFYYPGTIRESMKYYPGFLGQLAGAGWGWPGLARAGWGWLGLAGAGWG